MSFRNSIADTFKNFYDFEWFYKCHYRVDYQIMKKTLCIVLACSIKNDFMQIFLLYQILNIYFYSNCTTLFLLYVFRVALNLGENTACYKPKTRFSFLKTLYIFINICLTQKSINIFYFSKFSTRCEKLKVSANFASYNLYLD